MNEPDKLLLIGFLFLLKTSIMLRTIKNEKERPMTKRIVLNEAELLHLGKKMGENLLPHDVLVLTGELGTGKTTLTKGIAVGLGINQMIKSPTYTIVREYSKGRLPLFHMDVYRLASGDGEGIGLEEYFERDGVVVMEWGNNLIEELPESYIEIKLSYRNEEEGREIEIIGVGSESLPWVERVLQGIDT